MGIPIPRMMQVNITSASITYKFPPDRDRMRVVNLLDNPEYWKVLMMMPAAAQHMTTMIELLTASEHDAHNIPLPHYAT